MQDSGARKVGAETAPSGPRRLVFEQTIEGLFLVALRHRLSSTAHAALREAGLDLSNKLLPAYPFETWRRGLEIAVADVYPELPRAESYRRLGRDLVEGMTRTGLGRAAASVGRLLGPTRALRRINATFASADNIVQARHRELSPTRFELSLNEVMGQPTFHQGVLEACLPLAGARGLRVEVLSVEGTGATYAVEWEP